MHRPVVFSFAAALVCAASAAGAGGQVVDHGKVVADPYLDYRKYSKEIAASEKAAQARQADALSAARQSAGADEAAFQASLAAVAQSLNAGQPQDENASADALPALPEARHGLTQGAVIGLAAVLLVGSVLIVGVVISALGKKSRRRKEESVRLVDFARKNEARGKDH
jgi:hypothetical protein